MNGLKKRHTIDVKLLHEGGYECLSIMYADFVATR
jgi:hypothetical protein